MLILLVQRLNAFMFDDSPFELLTERTEFSWIKWHNLFVVSVLRANE